MKREVRERAALIKCLAELLESHKDLTRICSTVWPSDPRECQEYRRTEDGRAILADARRQERSAYRARAKAETLLAKLTA